MSHLSLHIDSDRPAALFESALESFAVDRDSGSPYCSARTRLFLMLARHLVGFCCMILLTASFICFHQSTFVFLCICLWMLTSVFCTVAVATDESVMKDWPPILRLPILFFIFGMLQGAHINHILDSYRRQRALEAGRGGASGIGVGTKTFDAIIEGTPFAGLALLSFCLMDGSKADCPWYLTPEVTRVLGVDRDHLVNVEVFYCTCGWISVLMLVFGVMELDYRVSDSVSTKLDRSSRSAIFHFLHRISEVAFFIFTYIIGYMCLRPLGPIQSAAGEWLFVLIPLLVVWLGRVALLVGVTPKSSQKEHVVAHLLVAFAAVVVNPWLFADSPAYVMTSRRLTTALTVLRGVEFAGIAVSVAVVWRQELPPLDNAGIGCNLVAQPRIGPHLLKWDLELFVQWALSGLVFAVVSGTRYCRTGRMANDSNLSDAMVLEMIPDVAKGTDGMRVRSSARGLSSYLLTVGTGLTSTMFDKEEQQLADFVIEKVLGRGAYGVVMLVRLRNAGESYSAQNQQYYAMKFQNTEGRCAPGISKVLPTRDQTATREANILKVVKHPFIVQLISFFEVPRDKVWRDSSTGDIVKDSSGSRRFNKAIVMEFCPGGDLDNYIMSNALAPHKTLLGRPLDESALDWLVRTRRFAAEMCVGLAFLHAKLIIYRDLKPQNVLLKPGFDDELHICFTDFGFSKQIGGGTTSASNRLDSLAGTPMYAAPEIMTIAEKQLRVEYTPSVDLYSLGKTILVMLWRTKHFANSADLQMPEPEEYRSGDPRVPRSGYLMIDKLSSLTPESRGRADQLFRQVFFGELQSNVESRPLIRAIDWAKLEQNAW